MALTDQQLLDKIAEVRNEVREQGNTRVRIADLFTFFMDWVKGLTPGTPLTATASQTEATVYGGNDGKVTIMPSGGVAPFQYRRDPAQAWGPAQNTPFTYLGYSAGSATVYVQDSEGNTTSATVTVRQAAPVLDGPLSVDAAAKTANWAMHPSFAGLSSYEFSANNGGSYTTTAARPVTLAPGTYAAGALRLRLKAGSTYNSSNYISNAVAVTIAAPEPVYNAQLVHGQSADGITLTALAGVVFKYNSPQPAGDPFPATMELFAGSTPIGQVDFNTPYIGQICGITYNGTTYHKNFVNGQLNILA
ncbi:SprB repeat-containing protein [Rufibacter latericius]|uniref:Uncharacterized protein n=1 Tax=Rufibacter latericius TaxID=2487040 RepID=A0A3M9MPK8_9BACT|nr:SprB repeat-containing protein [Rufibacter latericius]RNI26638.1 hypothetical protein EFB08_11510 [Rufibacter latericius]